MPTFIKKDCCWIIEQNNFEEKIQAILDSLISEKADYFIKKENLKN